MSPRNVTYLRQAARKLEASSSARRITVTTKKDADDDDDDDETSEEKRERAERQVCTFVCAHVVCVDFFCAGAIATYCRRTTASCS
jgi:hypothetical protein